MQSTTIIAFDQHAATTVAAVLLPNHRTPALHSLTSESSTIVRFVERVRRQGTVTCCYEAAPAGLSSSVRSPRADPVRRDRARPDPSASWRSHQDRPP
jgi:hypothetical protein